MSIEWTQQPNGDWTARIEFARHFVIKYQMWGDEDDRWSGRLRQFWRDEREDTNIDDMDLPWRSVQGSDELKRLTEAWHESDVAPQMRQLVDKFEAMNADDDDYADA